MRTKRGTQRAGRRSERGAVSAVVAATLVVVFFGFAALAMDMGSLWWERRQLQNGADASSQVLAGICAETAPACTTGTVATRTALTTMAGANSSDGTSQLNTDIADTTAAGYCGVRVATLPNCSSLGESSVAAAARESALTLCPPVPSWVTTQNLPYVEVNVKTRTTGGDSVLPQTLSQFLGQSKKGASACARAAWGQASPSTLGVLNITMSECDWRTQTGFNGTPGSAVYPAGPQYNAGAQGYYASPSNSGYGTAASPWPTANDWVYTKGNDTFCDTSSPGGTAPGGFAALDASASCQTTLATGSDGRLWAAGTPGNSIPCDNTQLRALLGTIVSVPVFDCMTDAVVVVTSTTDCRSGNGSHNQYRISGFAAFYLTGWHFSAGTQTDIQTGQSPCPGGDRCLTGFFLRDVVSGAPISPPPTGTPTYGLLSVQAAG